MSKVMVDIESLSTEQNATILSIGAVVMDDAMDKTFYLEINPRQGRDISIDTLEFWFKQPIKPPLGGICPLNTVLIDFHKWLSSVSMTEIWANGITFDITVLENAYKSTGITVPWKYNTMRDYRTLAALFPEVPKPIFVGDVHNALHDAIYQATYWKALYAKARGV